MSTIIAIVIENKFTVIIFITDTILITVDGMGSPDEVFGRIRAIIDRVKNGPSA